MSERAQIHSTSACRAIPNVRVLPVLRYRLSFARLAAELVRTTKPGTLIAVDLPHPLTHSGWLSAALRALPNPANFMIHRPPHTLAAPIVPNDAACLALKAAMEVGRQLHCVDDVVPTEPPDPGGELQDDASLPEDLESYFRSAWQPVGNQIIPRAARVAERLRRLAADAESVLFICEWRLWPFVASAAELRAKPEDEPDFQLSCAIVPEDALFLWQAGFLDDLPALTLAGYTQCDFQKLRLLREFVHRVVPSLAKSLKTTLSPASNLLETALQRSGRNISTQLAASCLTYPMWGLSDLAAAIIPQFGLLSGDGIESAGTPFPLLDTLRCERLYSYSRAETLRFYPPAEAEVRRYWGPGWPPPFTRSEAAIELSPEDRWSVGAHYRAMALAAERMREEGRRLAPDVVTDIFTPAAWIFCREADGDHRSVSDANAAYRKAQLSDIPWLANTTDTGDEQPDAIYTLSATRYVHGDTCPGVNHDIVSGIGLVYTGPECGPERYGAVVNSGRPIPREDPSSDSDIEAFELIERNIAFGVKYASGAVLVAHYEGFQLSRKLKSYAKAKGVRIIPMPLTVVPRYLQMAVQRRIFLSKTMRWHEFGDRVAERMVFWRIPDRDATMRSHVHDENFAAQALSG